MLDWRNPHLIYLFLDPMSKLGSAPSTISAISVLNCLVSGLSEVVGGLGTEKLSKLMPDIIATAERSDLAPHVRDGYIMMFIYLPSVFGDDFLPYLGPIIPPILQVLNCGTL